MEHLIQSGESGYCLVYCNESSPFVNATNELEDVTCLNCLKLFVIAGKKAQYILNTKYEGK